MTHLHDNIWGRLAGSICSAARCAAQAEKLANPVFLPSLDVPLLRSASTVDLLAFDTCVTRRE